MSGLDVRQANTAAALERSAGRQDLQALWNREQRWINDRQD